MLHEHMKMSKFVMSHVKKYSNWYNNRRSFVGLDPKITGRIQTVRLG